MSARVASRSILALVALVVLVVLVALVLVVAAGAAGCKARRQPDVSAARDAGNPFAPPAPDDPADAIPVVLTKTQLLVDDELVVPLPPRAQAAVTGIDARYKRQPLDPFIVPLKASIDAKRSAFQATHGKPISSVAIIADGETPYRLLVEVLFTLGQAEIWRFHLMVLHPAVGGADAGPTASAPAEARPLPAVTLHAGTSGGSLRLAVSVTADGIELRTSAGPLGTGCVEGGAGITVPSVPAGSAVGASYDLDGARRCAQKLKARAKEETSVLITATAGTRYADVIAVEDAVRTDGNVELFPEVSFGMPR